MLDTRFPGQLFWPSSLWFMAPTVPCTLLLAPLTAPPAFGPYTASSLSPPAPTVLGFFCTADFRLPSSLPPGDLPSPSSLPSGRPSRSWSSSIFDAPYLDPHPCWSYVPPVPGLAHWSRNCWPLWAFPSPVAPFSPHAPACWSRPRPGHRSASPALGLGTRRDKQQPLWGSPCFPLRQPSIFDSFHCLYHWG